MGQRIRSDNIDHAWCLVQLGAVSKLTKQKKVRQNFRAWYIKYEIEILGVSVYAAYAGVVGIVVGVLVRVLFFTWR